MKTGAGAGASASDCKTTDDLTLVAASWRNSDSMPPGSSSVTSPGLAKVLTHAELGSCDPSKQAFRHKCKDHRYYESIEETLDGAFEDHHLLLVDASGKTRAM